MAKKLEDMTRRELLEIYEEQGGSLDDFDKRYVNRQDLLSALLEKQQSAAFASDFEFIEEEVEDNIVEPVEDAAHSDQWYKMRGLDVPQS